MRKLSHILAIVIGILSTSTNLLSQWVEKSPPQKDVSSLTMLGSSLFAGGSYGGVFRSTDGGTNWQPVCPGILSVNSLFTIGSNLFLSDSTGVFVSPDTGKSYSRLAGAPRGMTIVGSLGKKIFSIVRDSVSIMSSTDGGTTWNVLLRSGGLNSLVVSGGELYAGVYRILGQELPDVRDIYRSSDEGATWIRLLTDIPRIQGLIAAPNRQGTTNLIAGAVDGIYISSDEGWTWLLTSSLTHATKFFAVGMNVFAASEGGELYRSTDAGMSWNPVTGNLYIGSFGAFVFDGQNLLVGCYGSSHPGFSGLFSSRDVLNSVDIGGGLGSFSINSLVVHKGNLYAATNSGGIFVYTNGLAWTALNSGLGRDDALAIVSNGRSLLHVGTNGGGVYRSTDDGTSWTPANDGLTNNHVTALAWGTNGLYAGTWGGGIFRSTDKGLSWTPLNTGLVNKFITSFCAAGTRMLAGTSGGGVYLSQGDYTGWNMMSSGLTNLYVHAMIEHRSNVFAATSGGVFVSTNNGLDWTARNNGLTTLDVRSLDASGANLVAGTSSGSVFLSSDDGSTWTLLGSGLSNSAVNCVAFAPNCVVVGTSGGGAFRWDGMGAYDASVAAGSVTEVGAGTTFTVHVTIGDPLPVDDLFGLSLRLRSNQSACTYIDGSATGPSTQIDRSFVHQFQRIDAQTVSMSMRKAILPGLDGTKSYWDAQFKIPLETTLQDLSFSLTDIVAMNSAGNVIRMSPNVLKIRVASELGVWPGDCNNDGSVNAADVLPIGVYYGQSYGGQNMPGLQWQQFTRLSWPGDSSRKMVYADADGDGIVSSADVLTIGLNYGRQHQGSVGKTSPSSVTAVQGTDGSLAIGALVRQRPNDMRVHVPVLLRARKPVYGIAFSLKHARGETSVSKVIQIDTSGTALAGGLMISQILDEGADVGITRTNRSGYTGEGKLMDLVMDVPVGRESEIRFEISNVSANDVSGNSVTIAGLVYPTVATGAESQVPLSFGLQQNYPNPFNPSTTIGLSIPEQSHLAMKIFDVLGREVVALVDGEKAPGIYRISWDGKNGGGVPVQSGVYYCRLTARTQAGQVFTQTRRMTVVK
jgi:photosystem II stability/assembly factor-like uncharacterized protein